MRNISIKFPNEMTVEASAEIWVISLVQLLPLERWAPLIKIVEAQKGEVAKSSGLVLPQPADPREFLRGVI
jgi:hypothetical protein